MNETKCPRCDSPSPKLHPAIQYEGEVQLCNHPWHESVATDTSASAAKEAPIEPTTAQLTEAQVALNIPGDANKLSPLDRERVKRTAAQLARAYRAGEQAMQEKSIRTLDSFVEAASRRHFPDDTRESLFALREWLMLLSTGTTAPASEAARTSASADYERGWRECRGFVKMEQDTYRPDTRSYVALADVLRTLDLWEAKDRANAVAESNYAAGGTTAP